MKNLPGIIAILIVFVISSCYDYDGPVRSSSSSSYKPSTRNSNSASNPYQNNTATKEDQKVLMLQNFAKEVRELLPEAEVQILNDSIKVLFPNNISYSGTSTIPDEANDDLGDKMNKLGYLIKKFTKTSVLVTGHTDNQGSSSANQVLSKIRADVIRDMLLERKVPSKRISSWGLGSNSPISSNDYEEGRAKNRRVEFIVLASEDLED